MKKLIKKLIIVASLLGLAATTQASPMNFTYVNTNALFLTNAAAPGTIKVMQVYNPGTNTLLTVWDNYTGSPFVTNAAFTNFTYSVVNYTNIYTNIFGVLTTNTYSVRTNTEVDTAASTTVPARVLYTVYCPSNVVTVIPFPAKVQFGLWTSNWPSATNLTISMDFQKEN